MEQQQPEIEQMMAQQAMPQIVRKLALTALSLGADGDDTTGTVKAVCQRLGLDVFAWYAVCREIRDLQHKPSRIGFIR
jgi:hypothetical protein